MNHNIELTDLLVFEDEAGNIYQDCVCAFLEDVIYGNCFTADKNISKIIWDDYSEDREENLKLKEIWHRIDEDTYKKVWDINKDGLISMHDYKNA